MRGQTGQMKEQNGEFRLQQNSFDYFRLFAALQVLLGHMVSPNGIHLPAYIPLGFVGACRFCLRCVVFWLQRHMKNRKPSESILKRDFSGYFHPYGSVSGSDLLFYGCLWEAPFRSGKRLCGHFCKALHYSIRPNLRRTSGAEALTAYYGHCLRRYSFICWFPSFTGQ